MLKVQLTAANLHDTVGAQSLLSSCQGQYRRLGIIWADQAYRGPLQEWIQEKYDCRLEIVYRSTAEELREQVWSAARKRQQQGASMSEIWDGLSWQRGVEVLPRRWVVERTFAWIGKSRRLCRDYEQLPQTGEAWIYLAMTRLMLRRLAKMKGKKSTRKNTRKPTAARL